MNRLILIHQITQKMAYINSYLELSNFNSLFDANIISEYFFRDLFNLSYDYNLVNANDNNKNTPSIDLYDEQNKLSIQVTSDKSIEKVRDTIEKFEKNNLFNKFINLELFLLTSNKTKHSSMPSTNGKYNFERKDLTDFCGEIKSINNIEKITSIRDFLDKEIASSNNKNSLTQEMEILINLLGLLSQEIIQNTELYEEDEPKPEYKIKERFESHSDFLISLYQDLVGIYGGAIKQVKANLGFDTLKTKKICAFLKYISNKFLREAQGNPEAALDNLIEYFTKQLNINGINPAQNAILFFLVDEIYNCNVFPNKEIKC